MQLHLKTIVVINKIDREGSRINEVVDEVLELFIDLGAGDEQLDFPIIYTSAKLGTATTDIAVPGQNMQPLFEAIIKHIPAPAGEEQSSLQLLVNNTEYDNFVGRIGIGCIKRGKLAAGQQVSIFNHEGNLRQGRIGTLYVFEGLERIPVAEASCGEIVAFSDWKTSPSEKRGLQGSTGTTCAYHCDEPP